MPEWNQWADLVVYQGIYAILLQILPGIDAKNILNLSGIKFITGHDK
jgi:hypothetical protein